VIGSGGGDGFSSGALLEVMYLESCDGAVVV